MAIQAQMYPDNLGHGIISQDWLFNNLNNFSNTNNNNMGFNEFNFQQQKQQQYQFQQQQQQEEEEQVLLQQQQQYLVQLQNQQQRNSSCEKINNDDFVFLSSSKNNCTSTTTASTTTTTTGSDYQMPMNFSSCFAHQFEKQILEIDRLITSQNERLKLALQEQRRQQLSTLIRKLEAKAMELLHQKDDEIARATKRTLELQDIITKMEIENQEWQRLASENEAMVISLNNTLEQLKEKPCCSTLSSSCSSNEVVEEDNGESCCNFVSVVNNREVFSNTSGKQETVFCKVCKSGKACILLLPCRHLSCCKGCEPFVDVCPVCKSARMASIEALIS